MITLTILLRDINIDPRDNPDLLALPEAEAIVLLNLNRLNVALSRPKQKLIVIASRSVTNLLVSDLAIFENAVIWKRLYYQYASELIWHRNGSMQVWVRGHVANLAED